MRPRLISLEGGEGAGKSTVIAALEEWLRQQGVDVVRTREPGGSEVGEGIRRLLLESPRGSLSARCELLLMMASRTQLVETVIQPALAAGRWVLCDRFTDASFAYQGGGRGLDAGLIAELERWAVGRRPDLSLLLDVDVDIGRQRAASRGSAPDRIEAESARFFHAVRASYRERAAREPRRWQVIDAGQPVERVAADAVAALAAGWQRWSRP